MATFKNLKELEAYLKINMHQILRDSMELERELATVMSQAVIDVVYKAYDPKEYERRAFNDGLADMRNMIISNVLLEPNGVVRVVFENITEGADTLQGDLLVDTIEEGIRENWTTPNSPYADPRPFVATTAERIRQNPENVIAAIKQGLKEKGFAVK